MRQQFIVSMTTLLLLGQSLKALCDDGRSQIPDNSDDVQIENEDENTVEEFIPTNDWQVVKPGQSLPPGLHVRLNMATGEREAKLLDEQPNTDLTIVPGSSEEEDSKGDENETRKRHLTAAMEEALKQLQSSADSDDLKTPDDHDQSVTEDQEKLVENVKKFKSMQEIKEEFSGIDMDIQTDLEIIQDLYSRYEDPDLANSERLVIIEDLEYYVHQVDNARDFADMGGFALVLKDLNHTSDDVRAFAAFVIGSAAQSNPPVQIKVIELNIMQKLIQMLSHEKSLTVRLKALYALSAIVRHFPYAQQRFLTFGGLQVLHDLFSEEGTEKLQIKAITLVTDLIKEQIHSEEARQTADEKTDVSAHEEKLKQYKMVPITSHLLERGWCDVIPTLLHLNEHDYREKTLKAMATLHHICADNSVFKHSISVLEKLKIEYSNLAQQERIDNDEDGYFQSILNLVESLKSNLNVLEKQRTEL